MVFPIRVVRDASCVRSCARENGLQCWRVFAIRVNAAAPAHGSLAGVPIIFSISFFFLSFLHFFIFSLFHLFNFHFFILSFSHLPLFIFHL